LNNRKEVSKMRFLKRNRAVRILALLMAVIAVIAVPAMPAFAATTADVTVTATPTYIAVTNSLASWSIGAVIESQANTYWWDADGSGYAAAPADPFVDGDMPATITNTGSVAEDIDVKVTSTTWAGGVGWTVAAAVGADTVVVKAGITGMANEAAMVVLTGADQELKDNLAASGTVKWILHLETGTFTDGAGKTGTVRITASAFN
jgi:hypothetical protein